MCRQCTRAWTVQRKGLSLQLRYTLPAIALALASWALWQQRVSAVRERISPWRKRGYGDPDRWRSLERWSRRCASLFGLSTTWAKVPHELAVRASHLVSARGPTCCSMSERVFIGAHSR